MKTLRQTFLDILKCNIMGMSREDAKYYIENDAIPDSGSVSGLIMYSETEPIAQEYHSELMKVVKDCYGEVESPISMNDLVWAGWSAMLPEISEEALKTTRVEIKVPNAMIVAFNEMKDGLWIDPSEFVDYCNSQYVGLDPNIAGYMEEFTKELQAYIFHKVDSSIGISEVEEACEAIEEAYLNDEKYVDLVSS